jgi:hypothetical protein
MKNDAVELEGLERSALAGSGDSDRQIEGPPRARTAIE